MINKICHLYHFNGQNISTKVFLKSLNFIYCVAFLCFLNQFQALIGETGLLPANIYLQNIKHSLSFFDHPTLFWFNCSNTTLWLTGLTGLFLSILPLLGIYNVCLHLMQWAIYLSIIHIGQTFYSFGWETMLIETGFFASFLCPFKSFKLKPNQNHNIINYLILWILFRNMFGSGLIKIRGDSSWKNLSALFFHFETQPIPNPFSWYFHHLPTWVLKTGVVINHVVELIVPFFLFGPRKIRQIGCLIIILFQASLIVSGNLAFLNWLTISQCLIGFDDQSYKRFNQKIKIIPCIKRPIQNTILHSSLLIMVCLLSIKPIKNLINQRQIMNGSFNVYHLVNTYGAFGHIGKKRHEIIIKGTQSNPNNPQTQWKEYTFKGKPSQTNRSAPLISPYHLRLDWQIWFAAMSRFEYQPWLIHFIYKLLLNDVQSIKLLKNTPFPETPPQWIKMDLYTYTFSPTQNKWNRTYIKPYMPAISKDNPQIKSFLNKAYKTNY